MLDHLTESKTPSLISNHCIAVLLPCRNEALTIAQVVSDFWDALPESEIYLYDNRTDKMAESADAAGAMVWYERQLGVRILWLRGCLLMSTVTTPTRWQQRCGGSTCWLADRLEVGAYRVAVSEILLPIVAVTEIASYSRR